MVAYRIHTHPIGGTTMLHRILRIALIILDAFLALTAFAGGIGLLAGAQRSLA